MTTLTDQDIILLAAGILEELSPEIANRLKAIGILERETTVILPTEKIVEKANKRIKQIDDMLTVVENANSVLLGGYSISKDTRTGEISVVAKI